MIITRRRLLLGAGITAFSPTAYARLWRRGGAPAVVVAPACTNVTDPSIQIVAPGNYCLTVDLPATSNGLQLAVNNVTLDLNGHTVLGTVYLGPVSGMVVKNGTLGSTASPVLITALGDANTTQSTPPAITLLNLAIYGSTTGGIIVESNNVTIQGCTFYGNSSDDIISTTTGGTGQLYNYYGVIRNTTIVGSCPDAAIEGFGGWVHWVLDGNHIPNQSAAIGMGGFYNNTHDGAFTCLNTTFSNNTMPGSKFVFTSPCPGSGTITDDAYGNTILGAGCGNNAFSGNIYA